MSSYRFARRSFLGAVGVGAVGIKTLLNNLEASAQTPPVSPPRLLVGTYPVGTVRPDFEPKGTGTTYTTSRLLKPFEDAGLRQDMVVLYGLSTESIRGPGGIGHQKGMVMMVTGVPTKFTRAGQFIDQDVCADGPSFDQIFRSKVPGLKTAKGFLNVICDNRVDYNPEISVQCMSYDYATRPVEAIEPGTGRENIPLLSELSPLQVYTTTFGSLVPGGAGGAGGASGTTSADLVRGLKQNKSVLDYSLRELARLRELAPASERAKIDFHSDAVRKIETRLSTQLSSTGMGMTAMCTAKVPPNIVGGKYDGGIHRDYGNPTATVSDEVVHEQVGLLHAGLIKAAFLCDLTRVATFQWSPGVNHIAFKGLFPGQTNAIYQHHPLSHRIRTSDTLLTSNRPPEVEYLTKVNEWYNTLWAKVVADFKTTMDMNGKSLLDSTVIPYVTEVAACGHEYFPLPVMIFGGKSLGVVGGQYQYLNKRPHNDMWLSVAKAFGLTPDMLKTEKFMQDAANYTGPIAGVVA